MEVESQLWPLEEGRQDWGAVLVSWEERLGPDHGTDARCSLGQHLPMFLTRRGILWVWAWNSAWGAKEEAGAHFSLPGDPRPKAELGSDLAQLFPPCRAAWKSFSPFPWRGSPRPVLAPGT